MSTFTMFIQRMMEELTRVIRQEGGINETDTHTQRKENPKEQWNYELILGKKNQVNIEGDMIFHTERTKNVTKAGKAIRTNK